MPGVGILGEVADPSGLTAGLTGLFRSQGYVWRRHAPAVALVRAVAAVADGMGNTSTVSLFCSSRQAIFAGAGSRSTLHSFTDVSLNTGLVLRLQTQVLAA